MIYLKKPINYRINFVEEKLENGLLIFYHQDNTNPLVYVSVLYHVGSKNEIPGRSGFAHFFEHLMFEGTRSLKKGDYYKIMAANGGQNNAYTNQDETYYYNILPSDKLPLALWLESERMGYSEIDENSIEIQREVVKEERKMRIDNKPYAKALSLIIPSLLFKNHPYKNPIIGFDEDLDSSSKNDYEKFYNDFYIPNNAILSITGDFDISETKELVNKYFLSIPKGSCISIEKIIEKPIEGEIIEKCIDKNINVPNIFLSYRIPKMKHKDVYVLRVIDYIFSSGESSIIINNIVNIKKVASYAGTFLESMEDYGIFTIYGIVNINTTLDKLLYEIDVEIENFKEKGISQHELDKQINFFYKKFISDNYSMSGVSSNLSHYKLYYKNADLINTEIRDKYEKITLEDIRSVANKYFNKNNRVRLYNIPENFKVNF